MFRKMSAIEKKLGYKFKNRCLLKQALTHPSAAKQNSESYQRLEFLGDALLDFLVAEWLFLRHPSAPEGELTEKRRILVNCEALAKIIKILAIEEFINCDIASGITDSTLCDVYESIFASIYLDGGLKAASCFLDSSLLANADLLLASPSFINYKGQLLELLQSRGIQPHYEVIETEGPAHRTFFKIGVYAKDALLAVGTGYSKKEAEQQASKIALEELSLDKSK